METQRDQGWRDGSLADVLEMLTSGKKLQMGWSPQCLATSRTTDEDWAVLKTTAVQPGEFRPDENKLLPSSFEPRPAIEVKAGDLLLTNAGPRARCGIPCLVRHAPPRLMLSGKIYRFRTDTTVMDPRFLEYYLLSESAQQQIDQMKTGISDSGLNLTHARFLGLKLPIPPLDEQRRIVAILEDHLGRVASSQTGLKRVASRLPLLRAASLQNSIMGESRSTSPPHRSSANLPADWQWMRLGDLVAGKDGFKRGPFGSALTKSTFVESGFQVYEQYAPINDDCLWARYFISKDHFDRLAAFSVKPGDFLVSCAGTMGRITRVPEGAREGVINQALLRLRVDPLLVDDEYFLWLMRSPFVQQQLLAGASGTAMVNLKAVKDLKEVLVPVPPLAIQRELVQVILADIDATDRLSRSLDQVLALLGRMRSSLLTAAFSGQLTRESISV